MPIYEYSCPKCNPGGIAKDGIEEVIVMSGEMKTGPPVPSCKDCGSLMKRLLSVVSHIFKGTGFYATDYKNKGKKTPEKKQ